MPTVEQAREFGRECTLSAQGRIQVFLTQNIGRRFFPENAPNMHDDFQRLRGTAEFAAAIKALQHKIGQSNLFVVDQETDDIQEKGYEAGVLNEYLVEQEFTPTYKLVGHIDPQVQLDSNSQNALADARVKEAIAQIANQKLKAEWQKWDCKKIRLSRYGLFQIILEKELRQPTSLIEVLDTVLGLEQEFDLKELLKEKLGALQQELEHQQARPQPVLGQILKELGQYEQLVKNPAIIETALDPSVQWEVVREIIAWFIKSFDGRLAVMPDTTLVFDEQARDAHTRGVSYPLRFRYVVFDFTHLYRHDRGQPEPLSIKQLDGAKQELACLLEGVPLAVTPGAQPLLAQNKASLIQDLFSNDTSTWEGEHCLFSSDNALIVHPYANELYLRFPGKARYGEYWTSVLRGIAYTCELRVVAKLLGSETTKDLEKTAEYTQRMRAQNAREIHSDMDAFTIKVSTSSRLVARLRNAAIPTTMSKADYAVVKFRGLLEAFDMHTIIDHTDRNMNLINGFLSHYDDMLVQADLQKTNQITLAFAFGGAIVSMVLLGLALPSYMADLTSSASLITQQFGETASHQIAWGGALVTIALIVLGIFVLIGLVRIMIRSRREAKRPFWPRGLSRWLSRVRNA